MMMHADDAADDDNDDDDDDDDDFRGVGLWLCRGPRPWPPSSKNDENQGATNPQQQTPNRPIVARFSKTRRDG